jgi:hypothetical protein
MKAGSDAGGVVFEEFSATREELVSCPNSIQ